MIRLILAGLCALPPLLLQICVLPLTIICSLPTCFLLLTQKTKTTAKSAATATAAPQQQQQQRQIIVIGGSTGIGYAIAKAAALEAAAAAAAANSKTTTTTKPTITRIVIVARNISTLQSAQQSLQDIIHTNNNKNNQTTNTKKSSNSDTTKAKTKTPPPTTTIVEMKSVDVTDPIAITNAAKEIMMTSSTTTTSTINTHLFLCVGMAEPLHHTNISNAQYQQAVLMNQLGTIYTTNAFLPYLKQQGPSILSNDDASKEKSSSSSSSNSSSYSTIMYTCSMGGQCGVYGYTSYAPTKFALRGYVEALHMELVCTAAADSSNSSDATNSNQQHHCCHPIYVQIAYPPDTDTPGYARENITKPYMTQLISQVAGLASSDSVGTTMFHEATVSVTTMPPKYQIYFNLDGFLLCTLTCGFTPVTTWFDAICQVTILNITRLVALLYLCDWHRMIRNETRKAATTTTTPSTTTDGIPTNCTTTPTDPTKND